MIRKNINVSLGEDGARPIAMLVLLIDGEDEETAMKEMENYLTGN